MYNLTCTETTSQKEGSKQLDVSSEVTKDVSFEVIKESKNCKANTLKKEKQWIFSEKNMHTFEDNYVSAMNKTNKQIVAFTVNRDAYNSKTWLVFVYEMLYNWLSVPGITKSGKIYIYKKRICFVIQQGELEICYHLNKKNGLIYRYMQLDYIEQSVKDLQEFSIIVRGKSGDERLIVHTMDNKEYKDKYGNVELDGELKNKDSLLFFTKSETMPVIFSIYMSKFEPISYIDTKIFNYKSFIIIYKSQNGLEIDVFRMSNKYRFLDFLLRIVNFEMEKNFFVTVHRVLMFLLEEVNTNCKALSKEDGGGECIWKLYVSPNNKLKWIRKTNGVEKSIDVCKIDPFMPESIRSIINVNIETNSQLFSVTDSIHDLSNIGNGIFNIPEVNKIWHGQVDEVCKTFREECIYSANIYSEKKAEVINPLMKILTLTLQGGMHWAVEGVGHIFAPMIVVQYQTNKFRCFFMDDKIMKSSPLIIIDVGFDAMTNKISEIMYKSFPMIDLGESDKQDKQGEKLVLTMFNNMFKKYSTAPSPDIQDMDECSIY